MSTTDSFVLVAVAALSVALLWFFFGSRRPAQRAERQGAFQKVTARTGAPRDPLQQERRHAHH